MSPEDLTPREGKVLRHVVQTSSKPVLPPRMVVKHAWSDLPHTLLQSRHTLETLRRHELVERRSDGYWPTPAGEQLIQRANKNGIWNS